jgi:hypothetical protein
VYSRVLARTCAETNNPIPLSRTYLWTILDLLPRWLRPSVLAAPLVLPDLELGADCLRFLLQRRFAFWLHILSRLCCPYQESKRENASQNVPEFTGKRYREWRTWNEEWIKWRRDWSALVGLQCSINSAKTSHHDVYFWPNPNPEGEQIPAWNFDGGVEYAVFD